MKTFYVCSYGGSGSKMLCNALSKYGNIEHIHSRKPPNKLEYIGKKNGGNVYHEWFNGIKIPDNKINDYYVIYIYRNPINAILSRFNNISHLMHIQVPKYVVLDDILSSKEDKYGIIDFYNNYTSINKDRNYKIYCVRYEDLFNKQDELSNILNIGPLNLIKKETPKEINKYTKDTLNIIYGELINKMNNNPFILTV
jgi:hypothetical protein